MISAILALHVLGIGSISSTAHLYHRDALVKLAIVIFYVRVGLFIILLVCLCFSSVMWLHTISGNLCEITRNKIQLYFLFRIINAAVLCSDQMMSLWLIWPLAPASLSPVSGCVPYRCPGSTEQRGWPGSRRRSPSAKCPPSAFAGSWRPRPSPSRRRTSVPRCTGTQRGGGRRRRSERTELQERNQSPAWAGVLPAVMTSYKEPDGWTHTCTHTWSKRSC